MKKQKKETTLKLNKTTIQNLQSVVDRLDKGEQNVINGGSVTNGTTNIPVLCI
jgi:hypothetical protein